MAEVEMSSTSESDDELALEVLSGFVKTVYKTVKEEGALSRNKSVTDPVVVSSSEAKNLKKPNEYDPFRDLLFRSAESLNLENTVHEPDFLEREGFDWLSIPLESAICMQCHTVWDKPASVPPVDWETQKKYHGKREDVILSSSHPPADSALVFNISGGRTTQAANCPLTGKESRYKEVSGKKIYHDAGLGLKQANMAAVMNQYNQHLWSQLSDLLEALPEDSKDKVLELQKEGLVLAETSIQVAHDQVDTSARAMNTGIIQRRKVWLGASELTADIVKKVLHLPFDGSHLFNTSTGEVIEHAQAGRAGKEHAKVEHSRLKGRENINRAKTEREEMEHEEMVRAKYLRRAENRYTQNASHRGRHEDQGYLSRPVKSFKRPHSTQSRT